MELTEEIKEAIKLFKLEEDLEHVIIPLPEREGRRRRCFLLKRRFLRVVYEDGGYADFPLEKVIEAIVRHPDMKLSESLALLYKELEAEIEKNFDDERDTSN